MIWRYKILALAVLRYALRFLKDNSSPVPALQAEAPMTPDRLTDLGTLQMSWEDHFTEKTGSSVQEEAETSMYDAGAEFGTQEHAYEGDGETSTYYLPGAVEGRRPSKRPEETEKFNSPTLQDLMN